MSPGGFAAQYQSAGVDIVRCSLRGYIPQRAKAIFHRGRRQGHASQPVLHIHDIPSHLKPREKGHEGLLFGALDPAAAMKENERALSGRGVPPFVNVQLRFKIAGGQIGDVRKDLILVEGMRGLARGWG